MVSIRGIRKVLDFTGQASDDKPILIVFRMVASDLVVDLDVMTPEIADSKGIDFEAFRDCAENDLWASWKLVGYKFPSDWRNYTLSEFRWKIESEVHNCVIARHNARLIWRSE